MYGRPGGEVAPVDVSDMDGVQYCRCKEISQLCNRRIPQAQTTKNFLQGWTIPCLLGHGVS
jgi:hypothetical protein